jgi:hypothetical protein
LEVEFVVVRESNTFINNESQEIDHNQKPVISLRAGRGIIKVAGGPGDRWLGHRKMAGREESPDTVLRHAFHFVRSGTLDRATRLVTPGGEVEDGEINSPLRRRHGKCHREYTAGGAQHGGIAQGNLRDVFESLASFGKGEKVG